MAERKKIVFPFYNNYFTATSIIIYQANILKTLQYLPDEKKPTVVVWHNRQSPIHELQQTGYPYLQFVDTKQLGFRLKKASALTAIRLGIAGLFSFNKDIDIIYPADQDPFSSTIKRKIYWKADFQENYYPDNFLPEELKWVKAFFRYLGKHPVDTLVLSSRACIHDLRDFYPEIENPVELYRFVSHLPALDNSTFAGLKSKYGLHKSYYIVCNQFWPHKNHGVVVRAMKEIARHGPLPFQMVFTGKTSSKRGDAYFRKLMDDIRAAGLDKDIVITDFIERQDQLVLMKNSIAVVQPSLFEGWSTVIEDARAIERFVIASSLPVNQEQIQDNVWFFEAHSHTELATMLENMFSDPPTWIPYNYKLRIGHAVEDLVRIFDL